MNKKTKHFVTFYYPGALVGESCTREIDKRDPRKALDYKASKGSYGFCFYSVNYVGLDDGEYKSEKFEQTGTFFIDGELLTLKQIKKNFPGEYTLIANMEGNRWKEIIKTNVGWFLQFGKDDLIINR
jgi:hypothetical protein